MRDLSNDVIICVNNGTCISFIVLNYHNDSLNENNKIVCINGECKSLNSYYAWYYVDSSNPKEKIVKSMVKKENWQSIRKSKKIITYFNS